MIAKKIDNVTIVGEIVDIIVDSVFRPDRISLSAATSLLLSLMILTVLILLVATAI